MARVFTGSATYERGATGPVVTVGNFDGVHLGHRALLDRVVAVADGRSVAVITFDPAPVEVLAPERARPRIQRLQDRCASLVALGFDVVVEGFDRAYAAHDARWFADEVLLRRLGASGVVVGWDFRFGHGRAGDADALRARLPCPVETFGPWRDGETVVSSSAIRKAVAAGRVEEAARWLGRPHRIVGRVVPGDGRGRTIGVPTANVRPETPLLPAHGVYAARLLVGDEALAAVMNYGSRPTFGGGAPTFEVHALDVARDLYGATVGVDLVAHLRDERRFASVDELVAQIRTDVANARAALA
jgi:riboflavin kinase/FMN adenylyltransferase